MALERRLQPFFLCMIPRDKSQPHNDTLSMPEEQTCFDTHLSHTQTLTQSTESECPSETDPIPALSAVVWSVYMIRMADGRLYTGISTDVTRRVQQHQQGKGAKALRGKGPLTLVWQQETDNQRSALQIEYRIKQWRKAKKEAFITNPCVLVGRE